jgi:hypothetical protein
MKTGLGIVGHDTAGFLSAVLQGVQAKGHEARCGSDADDAEHSAFLPQLVIVEWMGGRHVIRHGGAAPNPV